MLILCIICFLWPEKYYVQLSVSLMLLMQTHISSGLFSPNKQEKASASLQLKNYQGSSSSLLLQLANAARFLRWKAKWKWEQVHTVKLISREKNFGNCFRVSRCKCASVKCVTVEWRFHCQMSTSAPPRRVLLANELHSISQRHKQYTHILTWSKALKLSNLWSSISSKRF